jgi:hypothetical protein
VLKIRSGNKQNINRAMRQLNSLGIQVQQCTDEPASRPKKISKDRPRPQSREGYTARQFKREQLDKSRVF